MGEDATDIASATEEEGEEEEEGVEEESCETEKLTLMIYKIINFIR